VTCTMLFPTCRCNESHSGALPDFVMHHDCVSKTCAWFLFSQIKSQEQRLHGCGSYDTLPRLLSDQHPQRDSEGLEAPGRQISRIYHVATEVFRNANRAG
jgi:hypothetical protein